VSINRNFVSTAALGRLGFSRRRDFQRVMVKPRDNSDDELMFLSGQSWFMTSGDKDV